MSEQVWLRSKNDFKAGHSTNDPPASIVCLHGAESHSKWFGPLSFHAKNSGNWQHVISVDRHGWRGSVGSIAEVNSWIETSLSNARSKMSGDATSDACCGSGQIDIVATSWGALAALYWWLDAKPSSRSDVRSIHLIAPSLFVSSAFKARIAKRLFAETVCFRGLVTGRISLTLKVTDFVRDEARFPEAFDFIANDKNANKHVSRVFLTLMTHMRRKVLSEFDGLMLSRENLGSGPTLSGRRPNLVIHLPQLDGVIDMKQTAWFANRAGIRLHRYDVSGHGLVMMQPEQIVQKMLATSGPCKNDSLGPDFDTVSLEVFERESSFRFSVRHSHGSRSANCGWLIRIYAPGPNRQMISGVGEALPRAYLTGENTESFKKQLQVIFDSLVLPILDAARRSSTPENLQSVVHQLVESWHAASKSGCLALWAGLDLALVDWLSQAFNVTPVELMRMVVQLQAKEHSANSEFGGPEIRRSRGREDIRIRATIPMVPIWMARFLAFGYRLAGYRSLKIKVGDASSLARVLAVGEASRRLFSIPAADLTLDGNQGYSQEQARIFVDALRSGDPAVVNRIIAFEDPFKGATPELLSEFSKACEIPVMVDECLCSSRDADLFSAVSGINYWNLRIGKCGGLTGATILGVRGRRAGVSLVLGALVGEDELMRRAGDVFCELLPLAWREESFSRFLLRRSAFAAQSKDSALAAQRAGGFNLRLAINSVRSTLAVFKFTSKAFDSDFERLRGTTP